MGAAAKPAPDSPAEKRRRPRFHGYFREHQKCLTKDHIETYLRGSKLFSPLPWAWKPDILRICRGSVDMAVLMTIFDLSFGLLALKAGGRSLKDLLFAGKGQRELPFSAVMLRGDVAGAYGISERPVMESIRHLVEIGAIERQCRCEAEKTCANHAEHNSYRLLPANWPGIKRQWQVGESDEWAPKKPVRSEGFETENPSELDEDSADSSKTDREQKANAKGVYAENRLKPNSEQKGNAKGVYAEKCGPRITLAAGKPVRVADVEDSSIEVVNSLGIEAEALASVNKAGGLRVELVRPIAAAPAEVSLPLPDNDDKRSPAVITPLQFIGEVHRHRQVCGGLVECGDEEYARQVLEILGPVPLDRFFLRLRADAEAKKRARAPFDPSRYLHRVAEKVRTTWDAEQASTAETQAVDREVSQARDAEQAKLIDRLERSERQIAEFITAGGDKLLKRAAADNKADPKYRRLTAEQRHLWDQARARNIAKRELGIEE